MPYAYCSGHLRVPFKTGNETNSIIDRMVSYVKFLQAKNKIHCLAMTGVSSIIMTSIISNMTQIPMIYIRKPTEKSHGNPIEVSPNLWEEPTHGYSTISKRITKAGFIDDLIASGSTVERVQTGLREYGIKLNAILLYEEMEEVTMKRRHNNIPVMRFKR